MHITSEQKSYKRKYTIQRVKLQVHISNFSITTHVHITLVAFGNFTLVC